MVALGLAVAPGRIVPWFEHTLLDSLVRDVRRLDSGCPHTFTLLECEVARRDFCVAGMCLVNGSLIYQGGGPVQDAHRLERGVLAYAATDFEFEGLA